MGEHKIIAAVLLVLAAIGLAGCSNSSAGSESSSKTECYGVDDELMATLAEGANMTPIEPVAAAAVEVDDFTDVHPDGSYVVAMEFSSVDIADGGTKVGVWAVDSLDSSEAPPILAVDPLADLFTDWPNEINGIKLTENEPGVDAAKACLDAG
ncbi:hypothetical protein SAMN05428970_2575 [Agromyces sp. CF514]|uniref:hypothetical protein n=1 Tax=Agromyces sp. CF514 TaxID=1881031 RepID=UPI0008E9A0EF|nr:hypothetical protein [Agromyces sp. CF514]SFR79536.1 hypothetical protein SAMN05428970_2575 [Agromyces sp. CF514]